MVFGVEDLWNLCREYISQSISQGSISAKFIFNENTCSSITKLGNCASVTNISYPLILTRTLSGVRNV